ncbi:hypothetical protein [Xanthobacter sp. 91]|uniref:hypothetical protein n=1 Tax=Xanthobacter sp. 91 TaxID=1117244 RepID=UPI0004976B0C|nr:hypothetical protein [Xanthobacter sp. 91]
MSPVASIAARELEACGLDPVAAWLVAVAVLGALRRAGFRPVPVEPTRRMVVASMDALGPPTGRPWIRSTRVKHRRRLTAAISAAPEVLP